MSSLSNLTDNSCKSQTYFPDIICPPKANGETAENS